MRRMDNIYYSVDSYLLNNGFIYGTLDEKKELTIEGLKLYLAQKITDINPMTILSRQDIENISINDIIDLLTETLPEEEHEENLSNVVRYIIFNASKLQGKKIAWERETSEDLDNGVSIEFTTKGNIKTVKTHTYPSYNYVLRFLIDIYQCPLFIKQKELSKTKKDNN